MTPRSCPAYILAGGRSSRFGSDKALAEVHGQTQLHRLQSYLQQFGHEVQTVADKASRYDALGIRCLVDVAADCGPLAGLSTTLQHRLRCVGPGWLLLVGCDQFVWRMDWFERLAAATSTEIQAVTFVAKEAASIGVPQPIPGLYHTLLLPTVTRQLERRELSLRRLLDNASKALISIDDNPCDWSFNTKLELEELRKHSGVGE